MPIIGHGYFSMEDPDNEGIAAVRKILKRPAVFGGVYVVETIEGKELLHGFLLMNSRIDRSEHDEIYHDLGGWCKLSSLYGIRARFMLKKKKKRMVKKGVCEMKRFVDLYI